MGILPGPVQEAAPFQDPKGQAKDSAGEVTLLHDLDGRKRWDSYINEIKNVLADNKSAIVILPDKNSLKKALDTISAKLEYPVSILYRIKQGELEEWLKIKKEKCSIVLAMRSGIFAPANNLGLIIIDEEENSVYKQEQSPHYHVREAAFMRSQIEGSRLILGSSSPSLESFYLADKNKIRYNLIPRSTVFPEIKIVDMKATYTMRKRNTIFQRPTEDAILAALDSKGKALVFLNRKGFALSSSCNNCREPLKCPRCNINLVYHFHKNMLTCHYCNFKMELPKICPNCNSGYIRFSGIGTEKVESELSRLFPQGRIGRDLIVATSAVFKQREIEFDLVVALGIDNSLNRVDFRSGEKAFSILTGLSRLTQKKVIIETKLPQHHCLEALIKRDSSIFYNKELRQRKGLSFPPYKHFILLKLRGINEENVSQAAHILFKGLSERNNKDRAFKVISINPAQPGKLRGKFYWQVLVSTNNVRKASLVLKIHLKTFSPSGIIVTVDVDPL